MSDKSTPTDKTWSESGMLYRNTLHAPHDHHRGAGCRVRERLDGTRFTEHRTCVHELCVVSLRFPKASST